MYRITHIAMNPTISPRTQSLDDSVTSDVQWRCVVILTRTIMALLYFKGNPFVAKGYFQNNDELWTKSLFGTDVVLVKVKKTRITMTYIVYAKFVRKKI